MKRCLAIIVTVLLLWAGLASAIDGKSWNKWDRALQVPYIAGVIDSWDAINRLGDTLRKKAPGYKVSASGRPFVEVSGCLKKHKIDYGQVVAIVEKYMADHPEHWHYSMAGLIWNALDEACAGL